MVNCETCGRILYQKINGVTMDKLVIYADGGSKSGTRA